MRRPFAPLAPAFAVLLAALACKKAPKGPEYTAAERYERTACACGSSACVREAQRVFHEAPRGKLGADPEIGRVLSRALGCGARFVSGTCAGPGPAGCATGYSCLPAVGIPTGTTPVYACWKD